ncbi:MAG: hypothetical protein ABSH00_00200 [Bryobacteraceae bacterium]|jgi:hypothetical protein
MKLIIPHMDKSHGLDKRLSRLGGFLGLTCEPLPLEKRTHNHAEYLDKAIQTCGTCLAVNAQVMEEWTGGHFPPDLALCMASRIPHLLVYGLTPGAFCDGLIQALSAGCLQSVRPLTDAGQNYDIAPNARDVCGHFSGISFGPANCANDRVLSVSACNGAVRQPISIVGGSFMAVLKQQNAEMFFLAGADILDIDAEVGDAPLSDYFSRLVPYVMALRYIFGEECWRPCKPQASIIIDDPVLRQEYGYLHFESLLRLMEEYNFHTAISFIPLNYRRNSARIIRMFRENPQRLSICFHGNDHTKAEFASSDPAFLNAMLGIAEERMKVHEQVNGLHCDRVMVFPQDNYSVEAMEVLKSRNFCAAISRPYPVGESVPLTISDLVQPAVLRYSGVPLFTRNFIKHTQSQDIAFNLLFGKPILIGEHHDTFKHPECLLELVQNINSIAPGISWSNLESVADNSTLKRRGPDGTVEIRPYSSNVLIANDSASVKRYSIEWRQSSQCSAIGQVLRDGAPFPGIEICDTGMRVLAELPPGASQVFSVMYRNDYAALGRPGFMWDARAFLRRRLSEVRDNHLSKNQHVLTAARAVQRRFLK